MVVRLSFWEERKHAPLKFYKFNTRGAFLSQNKNHFQVDFGPLEPRFLQYFTVNLKVFQKSQKSLPSCFPCSFGTPKVPQDDPEMAPRGSQGAS